ncbi:endonuclease YncB(thermonuclease family) [Bradyrhizobium sp. LM2.7]
MLCCTRPECSQFDKEDRHVWIDRGVDHARTVQHRVCRRIDGPAKVISTDTLEIHGTRVRLWGIDAPDKTQMCRDINVNPYRCGLRAASDLESFIAEREVSCLSVLEDECGRTMAICSADGIDLGEWLVRNGLVLDWARYSRGRYHAAQRAADRAGLGLVGGQLCRTLAISSVHSVRWSTSQLF